MVKTEAPIRPPSRSGSVACWYRAVTGIVLFLTLMSGLYVFYWMVAANSIRNAIDSLIKEQKQRGISVSYRSLEVEGFPLWLDVRIENPVFLISGGAIAEWHPPTVQGLIRPWRLNQVVINLGGQHKLVGDRSFTLSAHQFAIAVQLDQRGALDCHLRLVDMDAEIPQTGSLQINNLSVEFSWDDEHFADNKPPMRLTIGAGGLKTQGRWAAPLEGGVINFRVVSHLTGAVKNSSDPAFLANWRDSGGTLEISRLTIGHGPLRLQGSGTFALDELLQPLGAFTARIEGYMETVDALRNTRLLEASTAIAAKLFLTVLAKSPKGQTPYVEVPVTLQDRELSLGSLSLFKLPIIDWTRVLRMGAS